MVSHVLLLMVRHHRQSRGLAPGYPSNRAGPRRMEGQKRALLRPAAGSRPRIRDRADEQDPRLHRSSPSAVVSTAAFRSVRAAITACRLCWGMLAVSAENRSRLPFSIRSARRVPLTVSATAASPVLRWNGLQAVAGLDHALAEARDVALVDAERASRIRLQRGVPFARATEQEHQGVGVGRRHRKSTGRSSRHEQAKAAHELLDERAELLDFLLPRLRSCFCCVRTSVG